MIQTDKYKIRIINQYSIWIEMESGEGMQVNKAVFKAAFEQFLEQFWRDHF